MIIGRQLILAGLVSAACLMTGTEPSRADVTFKFVSAGDAQKMVVGSKPPNNLAGDASFSMSLRKRDATSHVEKHMDWNEELVIQEGTVLLNYGDGATNIRQIAPGEFNGDAVTGGKSVLMHAGDIVIIPAGTWHEEVLKSPIMRYILFKTRKAGPAN